MIEEIWTEKYRPKKLSEIVNQKHVVKNLKAFVSKKSLPHCLFVGPAGVGKTTAALCIANELFGEQWKANFLELNASDERGIDTIRVKVKDFARTVSLTRKFKLIYLDEADALTKDAQHALRRMMEKYSETARFILAVNYLSKIIEPIQSRTAIFRFNAISDKDIKSMLVNISKSENLNISNGAYDAIINIAQGDMRKAINILQTTALAYQKITEKEIYAATSQADPNIVKNLIKEISKDCFEKAREYLLTLLQERNVSGEDIVKEIYTQIMNLNISDEKKIKALEYIGECEFRISEGANERIQLEALIAQLIMILK